MKDSDLPKGRPVVPAAEPEPKVIFDADVATGDAVNLCMISPGVWRASKIKPAEPEYPVMERLHGPPTLESRVAALEAQMASLTVAPTVKPDLTVEPEWHAEPKIYGSEGDRHWDDFDVCARKTKPGWSVLLFNRGSLFRGWHVLTPAQAALTVRVLCGAP